MYIHIAMEQKSPHNLPKEFQLTKVMETDIGTIFFYENIIVFEVKESVVLSYKTGFSILVKMLSILGKKPWIYISNRTQSYSINTLDYKYLNKVPNLKAIAIVNYSEVGKMNAELEASFCKKPFLVSDTLEEAFVWAKTFL